MIPVDPVADVCAEVSEAVIEKLVAAFYQRVAADDLLRPMYPNDDLEGAEERLALFLIGRFGGADTYTKTRGHPRLRARHAPFVIDDAARERWVSLMTSALDETGFPVIARERVETFFAEVATMLINRA